MNYKIQRWQIFGKRLDVPREIRKKVYEHTLSFKEFIEYGLDIDEKVPIECLNEQDRKIVERFGIQKCKDLDWDLINSVTFVDGVLIRDVLLTVNPDTADVNQALYDLEVQRERAPDKKELFTAKGSIKFIAQYLLDHKQ